MERFSLLHLADRSLLQGLAALVNHVCAKTADLLAHIAEVDKRKLYVPAGYDSMYLYCVQVLHMSEDTAFRRIRVARTARQFPAVFPALADGRLEMTSVLLLTPHLTPQTVEELLAAATHKTKSQIELLLAERFPQPDLPTVVRAIARSSCHRRTGRAASGPIRRAECTNIHGATGSRASCPIGHAKCAGAHGTTSVARQALTPLTRPIRAASAPSVGPHTRSFATRKSCSVTRCPRAMSRS